MEGSSLGNFTNIVIDDAKRQRDAKLSEINEKKNKLIDEQRALLKERYEKRIKRELDSLSKKYNEQLSEKQMEYKKLLLVEREKLIDNIFLDVAKKIEDYKKTDEYGMSMEKKIQNILSDGGNYRAVVDKNDETMQKIMKKLNIDFSESVNSLMGGCKIIETSKNYQIDLTFATKYEKLRDSFMETYFAAANIV